MHHRLVNVKIYIWISLTIIWSYLIKRMGESKNSNGV
jgi:hypothetical protein